MFECFSINAIWTAQWNLQIMFISQKYQCFWSNTLLTRRRLPKVRKNFLVTNSRPPPTPSNPSHPAPLPHIFRPPHCPLRSCSQDSSSIHFIHLPPKQTTAFHINWLGLVPFPKTSNPFHLRKTRKKWSLIIVTNSFTILSRPDHVFFKCGHKSAEPLNRQKCDSERIWLRNYILHNEKASGKTE